MTTLIYDIETYVNVFTLTLMDADSPLRWCYEISDWRNDSREIVSLMNHLASIDATMVGFNSVGFDYPILHTLCRMGQSDAHTLYQKAMAIIGAQDDADRWVHSVKPTDRLVRQVDLFKVHHFDNKARATSLKALEFVMRLPNISDLPFPVGSTLTQEQVQVLKDYNLDDVEATKRFYHESRDMLRFRQELTVKYPGRDWLNFNDTKIGKEYFTMRLEESGVACYDYGPNGRQPRQTRRPIIALRDAILPWIRFENPEFQRVLDWLREQTITETKGVFTDLVARVGGIDVVFGLGGIHGSVENRIIDSSDSHMILDMDVSSYYPNLAISNRFHPQHLGERFCDIYQTLYEERKKHPKGSAENAMLKLALNGTYGDSNNPFSVFYDPLFTMRITLNGQLLLCLLMEVALRVPEVEIISCNTDGICLYLPRSRYNDIRLVSEWWCSVTGLTLEESRYSRMCVADVNSYIAKYED
jgi:hypothetical protein